MNTIVTLLHFDAQTTKPTMRKFGMEIVCRCNMYLIVIDGISVGMPLVKKIKNMSILLSD